MITMMFVIFGDRRVLGQYVGIPRWALLLLADMVLVQMVIHLSEL